MKKKIGKDSTQKIDFENQILALFDTFDLQPKTFLILYPALENSTTGIAIPCMQIQKRKFWLHIWLIMTYLLTLVLERQMLKTKALDFLRIFHSFVECKLGWLPPERIFSLQSCTLICHWLISSQFPYSKEKKKKNFIIRKIVIWKIHIQLET